MSFAQMDTQFMLLVTRSCEEPRLTLLGLSKNLHLMLAYFWKVATREKFLGKAGICLHRRLLTMINWHPE